MLRDAVKPGRMLPLMAPGGSAALQSRCGPVSRGLGSLTLSLGQLKRGLRLSRSGEGEPSGFAVRACRLSPRSTGRRDEASLRNGPLQESSVDAELRCASAFEE